MTEQGAALAETKPDSGAALAGEQEAFIPADLDAMIRYSKALASSQMIPKAYQGRPDNVLAALEMGRSLGFRPMQALQSIASVNGVPTLYGDGMLAVCQSHPEWGGISESTAEGSATCTAVRHERTRAGVASREVSHTFTMDDAKRAGLLEKSGPWQNYPKRMLQMRARSWVLRDLYADALKGLACHEEVRDVVEVEATTIEPPKAGAEGVKQALQQQAAPKAQQAPEDAQGDAQEYTAQQEATADEAIAFIRDCPSLEGLDGYKWGPVKGLPKSLQNEVREELNKRRSQLEQASKAGADPQTGEVPK